MEYQFSDDGSILDGSGQITFFSIDRFQKEIVEGDACFICGAPPGSKEFNDEHIFPDWILRDFNLHSREISLPNGTTTRYGQYTIPCCKECNSKMGETFETPISQAFHRGFDAVAEMLADGKQSFRLFVWMSLIYIKTHLKDRLFQMTRDSRIGDDRSIADAYYDFDALHHIHCMARSFHTKASLSVNTMGTFFLLRAELIPIFREQFDFMDLYRARSMLLRLNDICLITVLNDSCAASIIFNNNHKNIIGLVSPLQAREILARLSYISLQLKERPVFRSSVEAGEYVISVKRPPSISLFDDDPKLLGVLMSRSCNEFINRKSEVETAEMKSAVASGKWTCLFDSSGKFITNSMELVPVESR